MSKERRQYPTDSPGSHPEFPGVELPQGGRAGHEQLQGCVGWRAPGGFPRAYPLGTLLKLELRVPGWGRYQNHFGPVQDAEVRPLVALGMVVRVEQMDPGGYELGVKFQSVYPDDLEALVKFLEASAPPPPSDPSHTTHSRRPP